MRTFATVLGMMALVVMLAAQETAPTTGSDSRGTKQSMQDAKTDTANAGRDVGHGTKKAGTATKNGTKKAVHKGASKTDEGANAVEDKTSPQR